MSSSSRTGTPKPGPTPGARPRIKIQIPPPGQHQPFSYFNPASPFTAHSNPSQYGGSGGPQWPPTSPYMNPFAHTPLPPKTSDFLKQFEGFKSGFKDINWDWSKTGMKQGEKSAFYLYDKVSKWSRKWFTHLFLMTIVFLYSVAGAYIFMAVEGNHQIASDDSLIF